MSKLGLETVNDASQALQVYPALLASLLKLARRRLQSREGCAPCPNMRQVYQTSVRSQYVNSKASLKTTQPHPNSLFPVLS